MTSETRRLFFCFLLSFLVNIAALILTAWLWRPLDAPPRTPHPRIKLVTLARQPPPVTPKIVPPRVLPKPLLKKLVPQKRLRPGARVHSASPAPAASPSGGADSGAPAPAIAAAPPSLNVVTTERPAPRITHTVPMPPAVAPPLPVPTAISAPPVTVALPPITPPAIVTGKGAGSGNIGKGTGASAETAQGSGAGAGKSRDAGEPFGIGQGMAGDGAPRHVVYVLDISGSMTSRIGRAREELRRALNGLRTDETFNLVIFSDEALAFTPGMAAASPERVRQAEQFLSRLEIGGDTNLEAAMTLALSMPDVNEVILLTDGVPHGEGETDFKKLARLIRDRNRTHARISAVGMVGKNPDGTDNSFEAAQLLEEIAHDSGGSAKEVTLGVSTP